jgi:hypothetical protein
MEFTIKITNEELFKLILAQKKDNETNEVLEPIKKRRGRPRVNPLPDPDIPKRPRGRPRKIRYNLN